MKKASFVDAPLFSEPLDVMIRDAERILSTALDPFSPVAQYVMFSGGNDSLVLLHLMKMLGFDGGVFHVDTGIGIRPEVTDFVGETVGAMGFDLTIGSPQGKDRFENLLPLPVLGGFPGGPAHYIVQQRLKGHPTEKLVQDAKTRRMDRVALLAGRRRHESARRAQQVMNDQGVKEHVLKEFERVRSRVWVSPIVNWTDAHMWEYRDKYNLRPSEVALELHMSGECMCGAMAGPGEREHLEFVARVKGGGFADCIDQIVTNEVMVQGWENTRREQINCLPDCLECLNVRGQWVPKGSTELMVWQSRTIREGDTKRFEVFVACEHCNPEQVRPLPFRCKWAPGGKAEGPSGPMCSSCDARQGLLFKEAA